MTSKLCPRCKIRKPLSAFWNNYACADGKYHYCKECCTTQRREFRQSQKLRIQLLRSVEKEDAVSLVWEPPPTVPLGPQLLAMPGVGLSRYPVDQRIVPQLLSVFQQLEQLGIGRPR